MTSVSTDNMEILKEELVNFGPIEDRVFEDGITKMIRQSSNSLIDNLQYILNTAESADLRFRAFFGITIHHRRQSDTTLFKNFVHQYIDQFQQFSLHYHVLSLLHKSFGDAEGITKSLEYSKKAIEKLNMHAGVLHNHCEAIVTALEEGIAISDEEQYNASLYIERVITLCPEYAKFYCTKGRLLAQTGKYQEAKRLLNIAIDLEDSKSKDYTLRINTYRNFLIQVKTEELYKSVSTEIQDAKAVVLAAEESINKLVDKTESDMENMKAQNLQMLAFFTAIVSFIIGSINILSNQQDFTQAALLILILAGAMVLVNVGFSVLISSLKLNYTKYIIVATLGLILIGVGVLTNILR